MSLASHASTLIGFVFLASCGPAGGRVEPAAVRTSPTAPTASPAPPAPTPPPTGTNGPAGVGGALCRSQGDCAAGRSCVFEESSCTAVGHCSLPGVPAHNCNVAVAMCACRDRHSFYGPGGCAGTANEPWELYACPCTDDADCGAGQRCVPTGARPHQPGASRECRPPDDAR